MKIEVFEPVPESVRMARDLVREALAERSDIDIEVAVLLVSELATNAVVHSGLIFGVGIVAGSDCVRIFVDDPSPILPWPVGRADDDATSGRGLDIVAALASAWGRETTDDGKRVWFDLDART
jgi:hypothetical protein